MKSTIFSDPLETAPGPEIYHQSAENRLSNEGKFAPE
jgi:hypothetical protein